MRTTGAKPLGATELITRLGELFVAGRLREATEFWTFPCPIEEAGELLVMRDADALEAFLRRRRKAAGEAGLLAMTPRIIALEVPRNDRFRVWLRWLYRYPTHAEEASDTAVYYIHRRPSGELTIEMMDVARIPAQARRA